MERVVRRNLNANFECKLLLQQQVQGAATGYILNTLSPIIFYHHLNEVWELQVVATTSVGSLTEKRKIASDDGLPNQSG